MSSGPAARIAPDLRPISYDDLVGWAADDHLAAFAAFRRSAARIAITPPPDGALGVTGAGLQRVARLALELTAPQTADAARGFFEANFQPVAIRPVEGAGFLTGYFEPEVHGSLTPDKRFRFPLYRRSADLVDVTDENRPAGWDASYAFARATPEGLVPYFDRGEIEDGALDGRGLELVYLTDAIDAFFIHVQGSAAILLPDGTRLRIAYAAKAGHPYTSIGKRLIERGAVRPETMTLDSLRAWLAKNPIAGAALMRENRSYVFFRALPAEDLDPDLGAIAAAGVQITPGRSLAVDHRLHEYGTPIWLEARLPLRAHGAIEPLNRLVIAQDTGSAIVGPARGDLFVGLGEAAGAIAGRIRHVPDRFVMLQPIEEPASCR
jgi:membrane-bound lytic murein transglycosylase A